MIVWIFSLRRYRKIIILPKTIEFDTIFAQRCKKVMTKEIIDINKLPKKPTWYLRPIIVVGSFFSTLFSKIKVNKVNCEKLKWPYILVCSHASFLDFIMNAKMTFPHHTSYICSIEEFVGREWLMRGIGAFPKRKYTKDIRVVKHCLHVLRRQKNTLTIYPEARYSPSGTNERIDNAMGKLAKTSKVPVVVMLTHGNFLHEPQWDQGHKRRLSYEIDFKCVCTQEEVEKLSSEEIQKRIEEAFVYDDYKWQYENKIRIKSKYRANNLHKLLYKCPHCGKDFTMDSKHTELWCKECGIKYHMDEYSRLHCVNGEGKFEHVPDWYRWEREEVIKEVKNNTYRFEDKVRIEKLTSSRKGFVPLGYVDFIHDNKGIHLHGVLDNKEEFHFDNSPENTPSIHIDYNFKKRGVKKKGQTLDIDTLNDTWYIYPTTKDCVVTKIHLAVEALYDRMKIEEKAVND